MCAYIYTQRESMYVYVEEATRQEPLELSRPGNEVHTHRACDVIHTHTHTHTHATGHGTI